MTIYSHTMKKWTAPWRQHLSSIWNQCQTPLRHHWFNNLTKFHDDRTINVAPRVLTRKISSPHVYQQTKNIFKLIQDIIKTNNWTVNVTFRVFTRKMPAPWRLYIIGTNLLAKFHDDLAINVASRAEKRNNAPFCPFIVHSQNNTF
ncbi:hypothetical protein DPMN_091024 [Dreissena polymorpha]|uniref:Uncharacterized protein n=1 Tax=Dreissena polymorpha TaxID=45954 RepID=A0A9D4KZU1_DREPO|nr:hypothetical protein DPMN_091024 [Dreissena polymorpha]